MRVVLADPSPRSAAVVGRLLEARRHQVRIFADGQEALACIKADPEVGALIATAEPLSISGLELCWETRLLAGAQRPIYVILMSSMADTEAVAIALDHGADDVLSQPPQAEELYARLRAAERVCGMQRELIRLATTDALTGMFNRRAFFDRARELCRRAEAGHPLSAIMLDIDHFKRINDRHGHDTGDFAICAVANKLNVAGVLVGRLGGEEFSLLLEGCRLDEAAAMAEALRSSIAGLVLNAGDSSLSMTCSFGVSEWLPGDDIDRLLKRADMALYEAKLAGRNRVVVTDRPLVSPTYSDAGRPIRNGRKTA